MALTSDRGRIVPPDLDDRTWQDLVDQMLGLIPTYAPQWTDHNPSDVGVALIELFAWLVESLTYRLNQVPEKNYIAFLNLLGVTRNPASPAHSYLTFTAQPNATGRIPVPKGTQAQTTGDETRPPTIFETDEDVAVLPVNLKSALLLHIEPGGTTFSYTNVSTSLTAPPAGGLKLTVPANPTPSTALQYAQLCLGFDAPTGLELMLRTQLFLPVPLTSTQPLPTGTPQAIVQWLYSADAKTIPPKWPAMIGPSSTRTGPDIPYLAQTDPLAPAAGFQQDGVIHLTVPPPATTAHPTWAPWTAQAPPDWSSGDPAPTPAVPPTTPAVPPTTPAVPPTTPADKLTTSLYWIAARILNTEPNAPAFDLGIDFLLFNSSSAHNALTIPVTTPPGELLGTSNGLPFQTFLLKNQPIYQRPGAPDPYDHLVVQVNGATAAVWDRVDDLPAGPGNLYKLDPVVGQVIFGNYDPSTSAGQGGHGSIPPAGSTVTALKYRYVAGGAGGNVPSSAIGNLTRTVPGIIGVTNLFAAFDGADEEAIENTLRRAPNLVRTHDRAVTVDDYITLAAQASTEVAIVACLAPQVHGDANEDPPPVTTPTPSWNKGDPWTFAGIDRSPGNITVIIVPDQGAAVLRPAPTKDLLKAVQTYLDARRSLSSRLIVTGPRYLPIVVKISVAVWSKALAQGLVSDLTALQSDIQSKLKEFLHPVHGGLNGKGWQVGQNVFIGDLFKAIMPPAEVGYISDIQIAPDTPLYSGRLAHVPIASASGSTINLQNPGDAALFRQGDKVSIDTSIQWSAESVTVASVGAGLLTTTSPLASTYDNTTFVVLDAPAGTRPFLWKTGPWVRVADYELVCYSPNSKVNLPVSV